MPLINLMHPCLIKAFISLKCPYYAFSNITFHAVCHVAVCEHKLFAKLWSRKCTIYKVIVYQKKESARNRLNESSGIRILFCYVRHEVTHLHNVRPWLSFALYAVDQSQRTAPSDQSQQQVLTERRGLERLILWTASHESFRNHLEMR